MTTFVERLQQATRHESAVLDALRRRGWTAELFGQGQLSEGVRNLLRRTRSPVRWMPDIVACRQFPSKTLVVFVDAKSGERWRDTGNHDIEVAAVNAALAFHEFSECPVYYVFADYGVLSPAQIIELGTPGSWRGSGSGTPFLLVPVASCYPFDAAFGAIAGAA